MTKLSVYTRDIGLAGIEVYDLLRDEYDIQIEFGDIGNILAYISIGDRIQGHRTLRGRAFGHQAPVCEGHQGMLSNEYTPPRVVTTPQKAFYAKKESLPLRQTRGRVCSEVRDVLPARIPILAPGEVVTEDIIDYIEYAKEKGCSMQGTEDPTVCRLNVLMEGSY